MPFALIFVGLLLVIVGARGTYAEFGAQVRQDFTGDHSFIMFALAIGAVGSLGYIQSLRIASRYFMALIIISLVLHNNGFFTQLIQALNAGPLAPATPAVAQNTSTPSSSSVIPSTGSAAVDSVVQGTLNGPGANGTPEGNAISNGLQGMGITVPAWLRNSL